jgi:hypothetical protein
MPRDLSIDIIFILLIVFLKKTLAIKQQNPQSDGLDVTNLFSV